MTRSGVAALLCVGAAYCQTPATFHSDVELVTVPCAAVDSHGVPVRGLRAEDFRVFDNGVPRKTEHFWIDSDEPLTLGVIIDASDSQRGWSEEHVRTARALIERILRPGDRVFVITVNQEVRLSNDLSPDSATQPFGEPCPLRGRMSACGASPLWNAVYDAARVKLRAAAGPKALLLITDGFDTGSTHPWTQAAAEVHQADATVYAIQYPSESGARYAPQLYRLVSETGGATFSIPDAGLDAVVARLESDLRNRYVLAFRPEHLTLGKQRHELLVEATRPNVTIRARRVYYDRF